MSMNFNNWDSMFNFQKNMMNYCTDILNVKKTNESDESKESSKNYNSYMDFSDYMDMYKTQQQFIENWNTWMKNNYVNPIENWQKIMDSYSVIEMGKYLNSTANDLYDKLLKSNAFYMGLYEIWNNINKNIIKPYSEDFKENFEKFLKEYDKFIVENLEQILPDNIKSFVISPYNYIKTVVQTFSKFFEPWSSSILELTDNYMEAILKDPNKSIDFLKKWKNAYDNTYGKLAASPMVGSSKEIVEQNNKMVDALVDMIISMSEYLGSIFAVAKENSRKTFEEYIEMIENGAQPKTFNEFFKFWSDSVENAIERHFYTDEFSNILGMTTDAFMKFKIEYDKCVEKYLSFTPIVTKSEVDSLYKTVYNLKKEVKVLNKKIENLNDKKDLSEK